MTLLTTDLATYANPQLSERACHMSCHKYSQSFLKDGSHIHTPRSIFNTKPELNQQHTTNKRNQRKINCFIYLYNCYRIMLKRVKPSLFSTSFCFLRKASFFFVGDMPFCYAGCWVMRSLCFYSCL